MSACGNMQYKNQETFMLLPPDAKPFNVYCGNTSIDSAHLMDIGIFKLNILNNLYDTIVINENNYMCDSIRILSPEKVEEFETIGDLKKGLTLEILCRFDIGREMVIEKGDTKYLLISSRDIPKNKRSHAFYYTIICDSSGIKLYKNLCLIMQKDSIKIELSNK
jgi:hypothetical protein